MWKLSFNIWIAMLVSAFVWSRVEVFFLNHYWNASEVAMFTVALMFACMVCQVASLLSGPFSAHFSHLQGRGDHASVRRHYERATRLLAFIIIPMAFGGASIMLVLVPLFFGSGFASASSNAVILTAASALSFATIGSSLVYAKKRSGFIVICGFAGAFLSIMSGVVIIPFFGASGAVWSRVFTQICMISLGTWFIVKHLRCCFPFRSIGAIAMSGSAGAFFAYSIICLKITQAVTLPLAISSGLAIYLMSVRMFRVLSPDDVVQLKGLTCHLPLLIHTNLCRILDFVGGLS